MSDKSSFWKKLWNIFIISDDRRVDPVEIKFIDPRWALVKFSDRYPPPGVAVLVLNMRGFMSMVVYDGKDVFMAHNYVVVSAPDFWVDTRQS